MRIAIFDHVTTRTNPIGSCVRHELEALCAEHDVVLFTTEYDGPMHPRLEVLRVPAIRRPQIALYLSYHLTAAVAWARFRLRHRLRHRLGGRPGRRDRSPQGSRCVDVVQVTETNVLWGDVSYVHFCHRAYLRRRDDRWRGARGLARWADHAVRAVLEPSCYRRGVLVVPSSGLADDLADVGQAAPDRVTVVPNPVDVARLAGGRADGAQNRAQLGLGADTLVLVFVALGHFERKGLPIALAAIGQLRDLPVHLLVVGGDEAAIEPMRRLAADLGVTATVTFAGRQEDVRRYLHAADAFLLPSSYEALPLVAIEAAACSLPLLTTKLHGVSDFLEQGVNGLLLERTADGVEAGIRTFAGLDATAREAMGVAAARSVQGYAPTGFGEAWLAFYRAPGGGAGG